MELWDITPLQGFNPAKQGLVCFRVIINPALRTGLYIFSPFWAVFVTMTVIAAFAVR